MINRLIVIRAGNRDNPSPWESFEGTVAEVVAWLRMREHPQHYEVLNPQTGAYKPAQVFLDSGGSCMWETETSHVFIPPQGKKEDARTFLSRIPVPVDHSESPDQKMEHEDLHDPIVHARNHMVLQHIRRAMRMVLADGEMDEDLAKTTQREIIRLFY